MKRILTVITCLLLAITALAQNPNILSLARAELEKRGLEEAEVRTRLIEEGIDVDAIPPSEYKDYQERITDILNRMQEENTVAGISINVETPFGATIDNTTTINEIPQSTEEESTAEDALEKTLEDNNVSPTEGNDIYGHSLFTGKGLDVFRTTDGAQAPETYILGEGDEIHISIFGSSQTEIHQRINPDGSIQPTGAPKIFLKGMTLAQGRKAIKAKLSQHYSFREDQIAVTITTARTLSVGIYGEVGVQGGFTISALNTAFNAMAAAGGPKSSGSIRNIQRTRAGKTERLDLYMYMLGRGGKTQYDLQNNDIIFVPVAGKVVSITGAVNRPMRYELTDGETLKDLIEYAGGLAPNAYPNLMQIKRRVDGEIKFLEYNLANVMSGGQKVELSNGDVVMIKVSDRPMENYVNISGAVYYGGTFDLDKNSSLRALIDKAKPKVTARTDYVFVKRTRSDETIEVLTVPFPGTNGNQDFGLQAKDSVTVLSQVTFRDTETISVNGEVRAPFSRPFGLNDRMTVAQAIEYAGGLKPNVYPDAYIFRKDVTNPKKMQYIPVSLAEEGDTLLQPGDQLNIYDNRTYTNIGELRIGGAVHNPTHITFHKDVTLKDLITMAGGFNVGAAFDRVEIFRVNISKKDEIKFDRLTITVDDNYNPIDKDFQLQPYDHVVVRLTPNFSRGRVVEINGRVRYPGAYVMEDNRLQLSEIIIMAGGLLDDASPYTTVFRSYNNRGNISINLDDVEKHSGNTAYDPILMDGDVINIVRLENTVTIRETATRMAQYIPAEFSSTRKTVVYQGKKTAKWYIDNYAGGLIKTADRNSLTVTTPNYQSMGTKRFLGLRFYPKVVPGSVITATIDQQKKDKINSKKTDKVDWERVAASTMQTLTSVVSMIVLIERLN